MLSELSVLCALFAGSPDAVVRVTENRAPDATISTLSAAAIAGLETAGRDVERGAAWDADCADDACVREAMAKASAPAVVVLRLEQHDNVYRFELEARSASTGERLATASDVCEICGLEEVAELVELRAAALGARLERPAEATLRFVSDPPGARVFVDNEEVGVTPLELTVAEGEHAVQIEKRGFLEEGRSIDVRAGVDDAVRFQLLPDVTARDPGRGWKIAGAVSLGLGVVGVAAGIPLILFDGRPYDDNCRADVEGNCAKLYNTMGPGASLATAGAIGIGAGAAMFVIGRKRSKGRMEVRPTAGGIAGRF